jgi:hypothetical protein
VLEHAQQREASSKYLHIACLQIAGIALTVAVLHAAL